MRALPERQCPWCGAWVDASDGVDPGEQPHPGAANCCYQCGRLSIFTALPSGRLGLRRATPEEDARIRALPEVAAMLAERRRDPLRPITDPEDVAPVLARWRGRVQLDQPLPGLPPLSGGDAGTR
jgi:hypothetical protein